jgi:hypothetical protein
LKWRAITRQSMPWRRYKYRAAPWKPRQMPQQPKPHLLRQPQPLPQLPLLQLRSLQQTPRSN